MSPEMTCWSGDSGEGVGKGLLGCSQSACCFDHAAGIKTLFVGNLNSLKTKLVLPIFPFWPFSLPAKALGPGKYPNLSKFKATVFIGP